ncbi:DUF3077 domain-containing protein [Pseudomonas fontis]|uniref:DUF3077 domain-containing protein n=1 Tax=Pseudomonas fontis TaxID=2942633 RepID=A0ABT5NP07_9PSED|nr:DUF3077 domain-containing protein [Pseudomonas fontis]MDD0974350.1 DUF3077 domain-containing protein [Pseudomonas fontis]MDD0989892.1 DUF3077 domain-containing protein [Pseudomonas fontis]
MKKIVPDPPHFITALTAFGSCDAGHAPLFAVRSGIEAEDALVHASILLRGVLDTAQAASERAPSELRGFLWNILHATEMSKGLVDALLDGAELSRQDAKRAPDATAGDIK